MAQFDSYEQEVLRKALAAKAAKGDLNAMAALGKMAESHRERQNALDEELRRDEADAWSRAYGSEAWDRS